MTGIFGSLAAGGAKGIIDGIGGIFDSLFTSDEERAKMKLALQQVADAPFMRQLDLLIQEAKHPSVFVAGARPALIWACVATVAYEGLLRGLMTWVLALVDPSLPPPPSAGGIMWEVVSLGFALAGVRGVEKVKGVARESLKSPRARR